MNKDKQLQTLDKISFTDDQIALIKSQIAVGATNDELALFMYQAKRTGLDPLNRQIYFIKRNVWDASKGGYVSKPTIQTSIDGFRVVAERSKEYQGQTEPQWCGVDGEWVDVWLKDFPPSASKIGVFRQGFKEAVYGVALYKSYAQMGKDGKPQAMWAKMPEVMLAKVAEALALRKAFPQDLSGLYTMEEMEQMDNPKVETPKDVATPVAPKTEIKAEVGEIVETPKTTATPKAVEPTTIVTPTSNGTPKTGIMASPAQLNLMTKLQGEGRIDPSINLMNLTMLEARNEIANALKVKPTEK